MKSIINSPYRNLEELYFSYYLDELKEQGLIESYEYEPESFLLSDEITFNYVKTTILKTKTKVENKTKSLLHKHSYTPDFRIIPNTKHSLYYKLFSDDGQELKVFRSSFGIKNFELYSYVDVKGAFGGKLSTSITFPLNQKWMYQKYGIYVQKIKPFDLFKQTFMPKLVIEEMKYKRDYIKKDRNGKVLISAKQGDSKLDYKPKNIEEWLKTI